MSTFLRHGVPEPQRNSDRFLDAHVDHSREAGEPGDAVAEILDMTGQVLIRREKTFDVASGRWDIDISDLTNGLYVLAVRSGNGVDMKKLVVLQNR